MTGTDPDMGFDKGGEETHYELPIDCGETFEVQALHGPYDDGSWEVTLYGIDNDKFVIRGAAIPLANLVYLIGPESKIYHKSRHCPALEMSYWPVYRGLLKDTGTIELISGHGKYWGRRPCKRCAKEGEE